MSQIPFELPDIGEGITEALMVRWFVKEGDQVSMDQPVCEVQTDKAVVELPAPCTGKILERKWREGERIAVGETLLIIQATEPKKEKHVIASPSTRRLARELDVNVSEVVGTGSSGRVLEKDIKPSKQNKSVLAEPLPPIRKTIAKKLLGSVHTRPHATHFDELNAEGLVKLKQQLCEDERITFTPILLKIIACTLQKHPKWNAHIDESTETLHIYPSISIGLATHTDRGLLVPVIHRVEQKSIYQLSKEIKEVTKQTIEGSIPVEQMSGSTFTVSNAGGFGGTWATPIIQPPEVAILAIHPIQRKPVVLENGEITARWQMNLSLSFDHRVFDGVDAIHFTQTMACFTANPIKMFHNLT